ncbi:hypothetical protein FOCG_04705 [Fusarium oxysporum f. sp. radicis-lycopersici 26381]|uniref:Uncharacterized protein n=1 Tax=Fusarium oxysporum Fo47 TaxID=660027 RepID=W9K5S9_FUSOX|nr:hypothetical protein FOZG_09841 [Fusarium oxysporum Fo47]EXL57573.1 hypothetical protein FOCG_04705 [Fusarium oxysporum f. sp. radicis-lycopersici 26381]
MAETTSAGMALPESHASEWRLNPWISMAKADWLQGSSGV